MTIALEHAGAQRGLLVLLHGDTPRIEAEARADQETVEVTVRQEAVTPAEMPESLLHTVIRTRQSVILDDASAKDPFPADHYIREKRARSVLCLPLVKQTQLIGVLYLENNLASHVFTPARTSLLELLASQAAISLENARLYGELTMSEERWRKLFESVPVGVSLDRSGPTLHRGEPRLSENDRLFRGGTPSPLSPIDITHEDDRAATEAIIAANARYPTHAASRSATGARMAASSGRRSTPFCAGRGKRALPCGGRGRHHGTQARRRGAERRPGGTRPRSRG